MKLPGKLPDRAYSLKARLVRPGSCFASRRAIAPARNRFPIFTCGGRRNMTVVWLRVERTSNSRPPMATVRQPCLVIAVQ